VERPHSCQLRREYCPLTPPAPLPPAAAGGRGENARGTGRGDRLRVLFFWMRCAFSVPVLSAVISGGIDVGAVVLPAAGVGARDHAIDHVARAAGVPVVSLAGLKDPDTVNRLASFAPDALVVACFPWRLPAAVRSLAPLGGINVHPSLLPALRGPEPVFWALRRGDRQTGVTLHVLDAGFDTGPILAQEAVDIPSGIRAPDLEARLAELGASMLVPALQDLAAGRVAPRDQDHPRATRAPIPTGADWLVPTNLPAGWAYEFIRGAAPLGGPLTLLVMGTGERLPIADAVWVDPFGRADIALRRDGVRVTVQFRPGTVGITLKT
jgi:methionyl-tRNA formyltransferase